jgi:hypothetical protein
MLFIGKGGKGRGARPGSDGGGSGELHWLLGQAAVRAWRHRNGWGREGISAGQR